MNHNQQIPRYNNTQSIMGNGTHHPINEDLEKNKRFIICK